MICLFHTPLFQILFLLKPNPDRNLHGVRIIHYKHILTSFLFIYPGHRMCIVYRCLHRFLYICKCILVTGLS